MKWKIILAVVIAVLALVGGAIFAFSIYLSQ